MEEKGKNSGRISKLPMAGTGMSVLLVSIAIAFAFLAVTPVIAQEAEVTTVTVKAPEYVVEGVTFDVTLDVDGVTDFNTALFDLSFDPGVLEVTDVTEGHIDDTKIPVAEREEMDSDTIKVMLELSGDTTVSGSGYLAKITFEVIGEAGDECVLAISNERLVKIVKTTKGLKVPEKILAEWSDEVEIRVVDDEEGGDEDEEEDEDEDKDKDKDEPTTSPMPTDVTNVTDIMNVTDVTDITNVTVTPTPTLAPRVTPTPEAEGTPTPQEKKTATREKTTPVPVVTPTPEPKAPGFEPIFAIAVMLGIAYILRRKK